MSHITRVIKEIIWIGKHGPLAYHGDQELFNTFKRIGNHQGKLILNTKHKNPYISEYCKMTMKGQRLFK